MDVDFTLPFTEAGITMVVPVKHDLVNHAWVFLKPLTLDLWITSFCFFVFIGVVVWILEHIINKDFHGTRLWFSSFNTMAIAQRETLVSNLTRSVVVIWFFLVFSLTQSYTASLTSWLTVQQLQPVTDINQIIRNDWVVGYQEGSYVLHALQFLGIKNLVPFDSLEELHYLFTKGSCKGGIDVAIDEIPYMKLLLSKHPDDYTMSSSLYESNGFGFAFPRGSYLVDDMSKAVEKVTKSDAMKQIQEKWFGKKISYQSCFNNSASSSLHLSYLRSLFHIVVSAATFTLILYFLDFLHNEARSLHAIHLDSTIGRRIIAAFHILIARRPLRTPE